MTVRRSDFTYHRTSQPVLSTMLALSAVEVPLVHLVVRHWSPT